MAKRYPNNARQRGANRRAGAHLSRSPEPRQRSGKILADAKQQYERYLALARAATLDGDVVEAQNCYQHAEHFFRTMRGDEAN
jgi:hypothetical protein